MPNILPARRGDGETLLVVERDPAVSDVLFAVLTDAGYRVLTSRTCVDALALANRIEGRIDLVLTDLEPERLRELAAPTVSLVKPHTAERLQSAVRAVLDSPKRVSDVAVSA